MSGHLQNPAKEEAKSIANAAHLGLDAAIFPRNNQE